MARAKAGLFVLLAAHLLPSCATSYSMARGEIVPAAEGSVEAKLGDNQNVEIEIAVDHLAPPGRLAPGATVYVAWVTPSGEGAMAQNVGALRLDSKLKGKLRSVTPHRDFNLTITPEGSPTAPEPTGPTVLSRRVTIR